MAVACSAAGQAQPPSAQALNPQQFQQRMEAFRAGRSDPERFERASAFLAGHYVSSLQVKALATAFEDEALRLNFAIRAFEKTLDPENYYEVYDAFASYSKVFRLHDHVTRMRQGAPRGMGVPVVSEQEMADIKQAIAKAPFENERKTIARQIIRGTKGMRAAQVRDILGLFTFENDRLEMAKFAYEFTFDKGNYFLLYEAFTFHNSKDALAKYIESQAAPRR